MVYQPNFHTSVISTKHPQSSIAIDVDPNIAFINVLPQDWVEGGIKLVLELTPWMGVLSVKPFFICTYYEHIYSHEHILCQYFIYQF